MAKISLEVLKEVLYSEYFRPEPASPIEDLISSDSALDYAFHGIGGMSTKVHVAFLNRLIGAFKDINYMEIGLYDGRSLAGAVMNNHDNLNRVICNDAWAWGDASKSRFMFSFTKCLNRFYDQDNYHFTEAIGLHSKLHKLNKNFDLSIVEADTFTWGRQPVLDQWGKDKVDIYFYDGAHEVEDQKRALTDFEPCFADEFIFLVDDWSSWEVPDGTFKGLDAINYDVVWQTETKGWRDKTGPMGQDNGWGGGWYVGYLKKREVNETDGSTA
tara:strand:- start:96 stop:908 length:813 start_codon:yes stop_codon:yes gene_type:complete